MKGFLAIDQPVNPALVSHDRFVEFDEGYDEGRKNGTLCETHLTIQIDDVEAFAVDPELSAAVVGTVNCSLLGGECKIIDGSFDLLVDAVPGCPSHRDIRYRLTIENAKGEIRTLHGTKFVDRNGPLFLWRDTTKLFTKIFDGEVTNGNEDEARIVAFGVLYINLIDFLRTTQTFLCNRPDWRSEFQAKRAYFRAFSKRLFQIYTG